MNQKNYSSVRNSGVKRICTHPRKRDRREDAEARQEAYNALPLGVKVAAAGKKELAKFITRGGEGAKLAEAQLAAQEA